MMSIFSNKDKNGNTSVNFGFYDGLDNYAKDIGVNITLYDDYLEIKKRKPMSPSPAVLNYSQIIDVAQTSEKEIEQINKSVIGRALVGGVLFGGVGAVVGGMSGGNKTKNNVYNLLSIAYQPSGKDEVKIISVSIVGATIGLKKFIQELREKAGLKNNQTGDGKTIL